jgi:hypothetical protein
MMAMSMNPFLDCGRVTRMLMLVENTKPPNLPVLVRRLGGPTTRRLPRSGTLG